MLKDKTKPNKQGHGIHELLYKTAVGSGAREGKASSVLRVVPVVESFMSKPVSNQDVKIENVNFRQIRKDSHELPYKQGIGPGVMEGKHPLSCS